MCSLKSEIEIKIAKKKREREVNSISASQFIQNPNGIYGQSDATHISKSSLLPANRIEFAQCMFMFICMWQKKKETKK